MDGDEAKSKPEASALLDAKTQPRHSALATRLAALMFLQYAFPGALLQLYSLHLEKRLGFGPRTIGICCATQALGTVIGVLLAGQAADRWFRAERVVAVCSLLAGVIMWLLTALTDPIAVFVATLAFWLMAAPVMMLGVTICFRHMAWPDRDFGAVRLWGTIGWIVPGWLLLGWASMSAGEGSDGPGTMLFRLGSVFAFALGVYAFTLPATPPRPDDPRRAAPLAALALLRDRRFAVYFVCMFGVCVSYPFSTQATPLLLDQLGVPRPWLSPTLTIAQFSEVIALALLPMFLLRMGIRGTMLMGLIAWTGGLTLLAIGQPTWLTISSLCLNGLCISGFFVAGQVFVNRFAGDGLRASVQALLTFANGAGMLVGHFLVGYVRWFNHGQLAPTFAVAAAIAAATLLLSLLGFR